MISGFGRRKGISRAALRMAPTVNSHEGGIESWVDGVSNVEEREFQKIVVMGVQRHASDVNVKKRLPIL